MTDNDHRDRRRPIDRRTALKTSGLLAVGSIVGLAGCADDDPADDEAIDDEDPEEEPIDDEDDDAPDDDNDELDDDDDAPDDDDDEDDDVDTAEWEDIDEIELEGVTENWVGVAPDVIEGEENPTLVLFEGESYDITWENGDGAEHNIEIWDEDGSVVEDYQTDLMSDEGETQTLEIDEVTEEMAEYVCEPHQTTMIGEIQVEAADNGEDGDEDEDEDGDEDEDPNGDENEN